MTRNVNIRAEQPQRESLITKGKIDVELIFHDGTKLSGSVFIGRDERVQDLLNEPAPFFPLQQDNGEILLIGKSAVAICKPLDSPG